MLMWQRLKSLHRDGNTPARDESVYAFPEVPEQTSRMRFLAPHMDAPPREPDSALTNGFITTWYVCGKDKAIVEAKARGLMANVRR
jgi:hypothetical protein